MGAANKGGGLYAVHGIHVPIGLIPCRPCSLVPCRQADEQRGKRRRHGAYDQAEACKEACWTATAHLN